MAYPGRRPHGGRTGHGARAGLSVLSRRVGQLDSLADPTPPSSPVRDVERLLVVMAATSHTGPSSATSPAELDRVAGRSRLLSRLDTAVPHITSGRLDAAAQYWIGTVKATSGQAKVYALSRRRFVEVSAEANVEVSAKPFSVGLFTSTAFDGTFGMWHQYLESGGSGLFRRPWFVWAVRPRSDARVCEIASASAWASFVSRYPLLHEGLRYPDWRSVAVDFDAVHVTVRAIAAMQGIPLRVDEGVVAPAHWDVESTFWLRWCFQSARLVRTEE